MASKRKITPERRASMKIQGQYLSLVRLFSKRRRKEFAKLVAKKGREAAIRAMRKEIKARKAA